MIFPKALLTSKGLPSGAPSESDVLSETASPRTGCNDCWEIGSSGNSGRRITAVGQLHGEQVQTNSIEKFKRLVWIE
jgi:hypothetical protein